MASLYELTQQALVLQNMLLEGDIDEQCFRDTVEALDIDTKVENICRVIRNLDAEAEMFKAEKDRMAVRQKAAEKGVERLKDLLTFHLQATSQKKVDAGLFKVSLGTSKAVMITDDKVLPIDYFEPQPDKINKTQISKDLKAGIEVPGACLIENKYVTIK